MICVTIVKRNIFLVLSVSLLGFLIFKRSFQISFFVISIRTEPFPGGFFFSLPGSLPIFVIRGPVSPVVSSSLPLSISVFGGVSVVSVVSVSLVSLLQVILA